MLMMSIHKQTGETMSTTDLTVADLERALQAKRSKLDDLLAKRAKMRFELDGLEEQIIGLAGKETSDAPRRGRAKRKMRRRVKGQESLKVWVTNELAKAKKGLTIDELIEKVQAAGYKSTSDKFKNVMYQCLFHGEQFQRNDAGRWVLIAG